jgi:DNA-binding GntR family transcriptional regulator
VTLAPGAGAHLSRRPQLSEEIAGHIREMVMSGQLRPGEFIRLEAIAAQLGTSVTPVREALMLLRGEDMVRQLPRRGYVVAPLSRVDVEDLFAVQAKLAAELARRATGRLDTDALAGLSQLNRSIADKGTDAAQLEQFEYEFHRRINTAAESPKLASLLRNASQYLPQRFYSSDPAWRERAARDHGSLLAALRSGDAEAAAAAIQAHVLDGADRLIAHLESISFWG